MSNNLQQVGPPQTYRTRETTRFFERGVEVSANQAARAWMSVPANKLSLPMMNKGADSDGDGLLSKEE